MLLDLMLPGANGIELMGRFPSSPTCAAMGLSRRRSRRARPTTSSSPSRRRSLSPASGRALRRGNLAIDYGHRRVTVGDEAVDLTATEYELLRLLSLDAGRVVTFETLLRRV